MSQQTEVPRVIRFGSFEFLAREGELRKQGVKIKLQEQPVQVLAMLLERPGQLVTREELQGRLWSGHTFVDFEAGLNKAINKIREALGDSADNPRFVETLPRRGYRFVAPVREDAKEEEGDDSDVKISRRLAQALFLLIQLGYLVMYGIVFHYFPAIRRLLALAHTRDVTFLLTFLVLCGTAVRIYLASAVIFRYEGSGRLFRRLFPAVLVLDALWATTPLLLFVQWGEGALLAAAALAFLPFSQRTLMTRAYRAGRPSLGEST